ncbi:hypothetical protein H4R18_000729 [Coemansia javaensis]|uniref:6,7-dimethyl-8-ribityllumazine synthase n=1 Tax=Coemansia javaensis TaxID=2761396 RepID=A0A9W8LK85_9FUNG|nr:hypothetical protein H4R18_000729 [Coemansia javaensis]
MKAVSNLRTRMRLQGEQARQGEQAPEEEQARAEEQGQQQSLRRRACTSGSEAYAVLSPPLALADGAQRAWAAGPRKLRGLHPAPVVVYARESPAAVAQAMDRLYGALVGTHNIDTRDIRVADVPTVYDLPSAVRRMGRGRQLVIAVALLARDAPWFDAAQVGRVRDFLLQWSQANAVPLVDGVLIGDSADDLLRSSEDPRWNVTPAVASASSDPPATLATPAAPDGAGCTFGHYLAHRAIEMFYIEHRGW